jgi:hypothetical protein
MKKLISVALFSVFAAAAIAQTPAPFTPAEQQSFIDNFNAGGPYGGAIHTDDGQTVTSDFAADKGMVKAVAPQNEGVIKAGKSSPFTPEEEKAFIDTYKAGGPNGGAIHN